MLYFYSSQRLGSGLDPTVCVQSWKWEGSRLDELALRGTLALERRVTFAPFLERGKVRKTPPAHPRPHVRQLESEKMRMMQLNLVLGENLEDLYRNGNINDLLGKLRRC